VGLTSAVSPESHASRFLAKPADRSRFRRLATRERAVSALSIQRLSCLTSSPRRLATRRRETVCGVCHSPLPFRNPHRPPKRPDRTLWEKARVESHPVPLHIKAPKDLDASIHETNSCIDQPPDCQRGCGFPGGSRPWRLARGRGRLGDGPAPRPGGEGGRLRTTTSARRISTPGGRRASRSIVAPPDAVAGEGSRAVSARGRVPRRHLNRGRGPLQEGRAFFKPRTW
jgi:hypothetical protein